MTCTKIIQRWKKLMLAQGFERWQKQVQKMSQLRQTSACIIRRWVRAEISRAWTKWHMVISKQKHAERVQKTILCRWSNMILATAMHKWRTESNMLPMQVNLASKVIRRLQNRRLWAPFLRWNKAVQYAVYVKDVASKVVLRMRNRFAWYSFARWQGATQDLIRMRRITAKVVMKWQYWTLSQALMTWQASTRQKAISTQKTMKALKRWCQQHLWQGLYAWVRYHNIISFATKVVLRLKARQVWAALLQWKDTTSSNKHSLNVLKKVVSRWSQAVKARIFYAWVDFLRRRQQCKFILKRTCKRWFKIELYCALIQWRSSSCLRCFARTMVQKLRNRWYWAAMNAWMERTAINKQRRTVMEKIIRRWSHQEVSRVFEAWYIATIHHSIRARRLAATPQLRALFSLQFLSELYRSWKHLTKIKIEANNLVVKRWSWWLSLWSKVVKHRSFWRNAKFRALDVGQINRVRTFFRAFVHGIEIQCTHNRYANQVANLQHQHKLGVHQLEKECGRKLLQARVERIVLSKTVITRMLNIQKAVILDNFYLASKLLKVRLAEAKIHTDRICKRKALALCGRCLQQWVIEVQASRIDVLESAGRNSVIRMEQLENDKLMLQKLVEEALTEQQQLAMEYHMITATKPKGKTKARQNSRSRSPLRQKSRNPP
jgi:hypothetical protein